MRARVPPWWLPLWLGCGPCDSVEIRSVRAPPGVAVQVLGVDARGAVGFSGGALGPDGHVWVVSERQSRVFRMEQRGAVLSALDDGVAVDGLGTGQEVEALAIATEKDLVLGTEGRGDHEYDDVVVAQADGASIEVSARLPVVYPALGMAAGGNHGVEGACAAGGILLVGIEERRGDGTAQLLMQRGGDSAWLSYRMGLTTDTGRLSSLDCARASTGERLEVLAIERHYGVARVLSFAIELGDGSGDTTVTPKVLLDLASVVEPLPNFEIVVRTNDDALVLITDNHHGGVTGPTQALRITGLPLPAIQKR